MDRDKEEKIKEVLKDFWHDEGIASGDASNAILLLQRIWEIIYP